MAAAGGGAAEPVAAGGSDDAWEDDEARIDFDHFLSMLRERSIDLDKFDDRWARLVEDTEGRGARARCKVFVGAYSH